MRGITPFLERSMKCLKQSFYSCGDMWLKNSFSGAFTFFPRLISWNCFISVSRTLLCGNRLKRVFLSLWTLSWSEEWGYNCNVAGESGPIRERELDMSRHILTSRSRLVLFLATSSNDWAVYWMQPLSRGGGEGWSFSMMRRVIHVPCRDRAGGSLHLSYSGVVEASEAPGTS